MQRIRLEILTEVTEATGALQDFFWYLKGNGKLWVLELVEDQDGNFRLFRHYGKEDASKFTKRLEYVTECLESALNKFEKVFKKKLDKGKYRKFKNGEGTNSPGLMNIFKPSNKKKVPKKDQPKEQPQTEHRKLLL